MRMLAIVLYVALASGGACLAASPVPAVPAVVEATNPSMSPDAKSVVTIPDWRMHPEAIALNEQNKILKQYHSSLLDTVYWALGLLGGTLAVIAGATWLVNFKLYEADKQKLVEIFESRAKEANAELTAKIETAKTEMSRSMQTMLDGYQDRLSGELLALRADLTSSTSTATEEAKKFDSKLDKLKDLTSAHKKEMSFVRALVHEVEERVWTLQKVPANVLLTQTQAIRAANRAENAWQVKMILGRMKVTAESILASGVEISKFTADRAINACKEVEADFSVQAGEVLEILGKMKIEKEDEDSAT